jgi:hypothetical protein
MVQICFETIVFNKIWLTFYEGSKFCSINVEALIIWLLYNLKLIGYYHVVVNQVMSQFPVITSISRIVRYILSVICTSVACAVGPSVTTSSTDFSFQSLIFWNLFEFSAAEIT